jgi:hypothetical protein
MTEFISETLFEAIFLLVSAIIFSFIVWKLKGSKTEFGPFLTKYGELLAYAGLLFVVAIYALVEWWT